MSNNYLRFTATLAISCLAASGLLTVVHQITQPKILAQKQLEEAESLKEVFPDAAAFKAVEEEGRLLYYQALDKDQRVLGYVFKALGKGYSSEIVTVVGIDTAGRIKRIKILSQNETPGLGTKIVEVIQKETLWDVLLKKARVKEAPEPWFQVSFRGKNAAQLEGAVDTITGATISSEAVIASVQKKAKEILEKIKDDR